MVFAAPRSETFQQPYNQKQKLKSRINSPEQHTLLVKTLSCNNFRWHQFFVDNYFPHLTKNPSLFTDEKFYYF